MGWTLVTAVWRDNPLLCGNLQSGAEKKHHIGGFIIFYVEMQLPTCGGNGKSVVSSKTLWMLLDKFHTGMESSPTQDHHPVPLQT
jgi:hypothetical protein